MSNNKIFSYWNAGYLLHLITLFEVIFFGILYWFLDIPSWLATDGLLILKLIALSPAVCMPLFAQLDARSRYQDYKFVKDRLYLYGFQTRILKPFMKSRCQRDAAKTAATELGMMRQCEEYLKQKGYEWYHLFPDILFKQPSILLTKNFWMTTLFAKTYRPQINFSKRKSTDVEGTSTFALSRCAKISSSF